MKRRLNDSPAGVARSDGYEPKVEIPSAFSASSGVGGLGIGAEMTDEMKQMVATLVSQQLVAGLLVSHGEVGGGSRFGRVPFPAEDEQNVNAFLHQKLGKDSLTRRPGPGGRKLTYIESCKAIELANRAFGFNGWSCRIIECKEEFREKRGDRWSLAFSSLVRIELKDGTSHEDVGFGSSDGQRDICAALEQAKKASISDARKRALRLFGEYLGNSCYDREHIKEVHSNRPMAPLAAAPNVTLPAQQQQRQALGTAVAAQPPQIKLQPGVQPGQSPQVNRQPGVQQGGFVPQQQPLQQHQKPLQQQPQQQHLQQQQQQQQQQRQQQQWKPPQVPANPMAGNNRTVGHQQPAPIPSGILAVAPRTPALQAAEETKNPAVMGRSTSANTVTTTEVSVSTHNQHQPRQPLRPYTANTPPPTRMMIANHPPTPSMVKTERSAMAQAQSNAQFNMEDLSLSQFDYEPDASDAALAAKRMRM